MQSVIDSEFKEQTVISVLHRFKYIGGFDRVAVMSQGQLLECDSSEALLRRDSAFKRLYSSQGSRRS